MESVPKDLLQALLSELECPVCLEYMVSPITLCENGHNFCHTCGSGVQQCPTCRGKILVTRNKALENVARQLQYPCSNRKSGCKVTFSVDSIREHEKDCPYRPFNCPISTDGKQCPCKTQLTDMKDHITRHHNGCFSQVDGQSSWAGAFGKGNENYAGVIFTFDEIFQWCLACHKTLVPVSHQSPITNKQSFTNMQSVTKKQSPFVSCQPSFGTPSICGCNCSGNFNFLCGFVKYIGPKTNASKYKYEISLESDIRLRTVQDGTYNLETTVENVNKTSCFYITYETIRQFINTDGLLNFNIKISKIE